jgi:uncharacterized protein YdbL (DUF1318 family)
MKKILTAIVLTLALQVAWAADIHSAKNEGLVGEARNGYLAAVKTPASSDIQALVAEVNGKRKQKFQQAAKKSGATMDQVQHRFYQLAVDKTKPGDYYQDANGRWTKK